MSSPHRAGFINLIGKPNAGKSTLMNVLLGERLAAVTHKAQTTRHRLLGIAHGEDYQIVFSDTPGHGREQPQIVEPIGDVLLHPGAK